MIYCQSINKKFENHVVFQDFHYNIDSKGIHVVTGQSGSGKTTLSRIILALEKPDKGNIIIRENTTFSVLFPENRLLPTATALQNVMFVYPDEKKAMDLFKTIKLSGSELLYPMELSSGMQRRVALARALIFPCDLLILDEPFTGLDQTLKEHIAKVLLEYSKKIPILILSHERELLKPIATTYCNLEKEKINAFHSQRIG